MDVGKLNEEKMREALTCLDDFAVEEIVLIIGGGGAMLLAHSYPLATSDIDAVPKGMDIQSLGELVRKVAAKLNIAKDWLNPYYSAFAHNLPADYGDRLIEVFRGEKVVGLALGAEDLLVMKCFAHRQKDVGHAKMLLKRGADFSFVQRHIENLKTKGFLGCDQALDFLDDLLDQI